MTQSGRDRYQNYKLLGAHNRRPPTTEPPEEPPQPRVLDVQSGVHVIYTEDAIPVSAVRVVHPSNPEAPSVLHSVTVLNVPPAAGLKLHRHETEETYYILSGSGTMLLATGEREVVPGDFVYLPSWCEHGIANSGKVTLTVLIITAPPNR